MLYIYTNGSWRRGIGSRLFVFPLHIPVWYTHALKGDQVVHPVIDGEKKGGEPHFCPYCIQCILHIVVYGAGTEIIWGGGGLFLVCVICSAYIYLSPPITHIYSRIHIWVHIIGGACVRNVFVKRPYFIETPYSEVHICVGSKTKKISVNIL